MDWLGGHVGILVPVKEQLLSCICKLRDQGIQCTNQMVMREAAPLVPSFLGKSVTAKEHIVRHFTKHLGLTQRTAMHTTQKHYKDIKNEAKDFIAMMRERIADRNKDDILNMDQTPIAYTFHSRKILETKGTKTIQVRASTKDTKRVTVAVTITASRKMLSPFMVFKRVPNGCIAK